MNIAPQKPQYPVNYAPGYIGFTIRKHDAIAFGIRWFENQWMELRGQRLPSHTFVIVDEDRTIEAFMKGVAYGSLSDYLNDPDVALIVRRPYHWNWDRGQRIVSAACRHLGHKYGFTLIGAMALTNNLLLGGKLLKFVTRGWSERVLCKLADDKSQEICSELVALSMQEDEELKMRGILQSPANTIKPSPLMYDAMAFEPPAYAVELVN